MGYSFRYDDQEFCYNNAKSWQFGWFSDETIEIGLNQQFIGSLKGQVNYGNGESESKVIVKVNDPNSNVAYYIGFNHQVKHNKDTREAGNLVTIQEYIGDGRAVSMLIGKIGANSHWTRSLGSDTVTVTVGAITVDPDNGLADVTITYGTASPTTSQPTTMSPTASPLPPTLPPTTGPTVTCAVRGANCDSAAAIGAVCCNGCETCGKPSNRVCL
jgi:hypothetical protein